jgi:predicted transposase YbfD/YdcC
LPDGDETKRTNEIKIAAPLLEAIDIAGRVITGDALLTQRELANTVVERGAHYHFTAKGNQPTIEQDIGVLFAGRGAPDYVEVSPPDHGRIETRRIWCSTRLNHYLDFPHVAQVFLVEREVIVKKSRKLSTEVALGVTSCSPEQASPATVLRDNRGHWAIENSCHYVLDHTWDEDHCRIRTGYGPENTSRLRRFAISVLNLHVKPGDSIASMTRKLASNTRLVFDYMRMTKNSLGHVAAA